MPAMLDKTVIDRMSALDLDDCHVFGHQTSLPNYVSFDGAAASFDKR